MKIRRSAGCRSKSAIDRRPVDGRGPGETRVRLGILCCCPQRGFGNGKPFQRLMIAQDTGSAILGEARGDLFTGSGFEAGEIAGRIKAEAGFWAAGSEGLEAMKRGADIMISHEDRILWQTVAKTAKPIRGRSLSEFDGLLSTNTNKRVRIDSDSSGSHGC